MSAEKRSISAPRQLFASADARKEMLGYSTFSDYVQALMRADTISGGAHLRDEAPRAVPDHPGIKAVPAIQTETHYHKLHKLKLKK